MEISQVKFGKKNVGFKDRESGNCRESRRHMRQNSSGGN